MYAISSRTVYAGGVKDYDVSTLTLNPGQLTRIYFNTDDGGAAPVQDSTDRLTIDVDLVYRYLTVH